MRPLKIKLKFHFLSAPLPGTFQELQHLHTATALDSTDMGHFHPCESSVEQHWCKTSEFRKHELSFPSASKIDAVILITLTLTVKEKTERVCTAREILYLSIGFTTESRRS